MRQHFSIELPSNYANHLFRALWVIWWARKFNSWCVALGMEISFILCSIRASFQICKTQFLSCSAVWIILWWSQKFSHWKLVRIYIFVISWSIQWILLPIMQDALLRQYGNETALLLYRSSFQYANHLFSCLSNFGELRNSILGVVIVIGGLFLTLFNRASA